MSAPGSAGDAQCPSDTALLEYLHGPRGEETSAKIEAHLDQCEVCRKALSILVALSATGTTASSQAAPEPASCERLGRYIILHELGRGGMGVVYEAYDPDLDRKVALKLVGGARGAAEASDDRESLYSEAAKMARLRHPNVVTVYDAGLDGGRLFIAMELMSGGTLRAYQGREGVSWEQTLRMLIDAGRGLAAAHDVGLIHRDFKPDNVLVDADGRAKVADFGLARLAAKESHDGSGTPRYMPPEGADPRSVDPRYDQYSFCVAALEFGRLDPTAKVSAEVEAILSRGCSADPDDRFSSMDAVLEKLSGTLDDARSRARRVGWGLALAAAGALVAVTTLGMPERPAAKLLTSPWTLGDAVSVMANFVRHDPEQGGVEWVQVHHALDGRGQAWRASMLALEGPSNSTLDDAIGDARMRCLAQGRAEFIATVQQLRHGDARVLSRSVAMVNALAQPGQCDLQEGARRLELAPPPELEDAVDAIGLRAAQLVAQLRAARYRQAESLAEELLVDAERVGHLPTLGYVRYLHADAIARAGDLERAEPLFAMAVRDSGYGRDLQQVARTQLVLAQRRLGISAAPDHAARALSGAEVAIYALGGDSVLEGLLERVRGDLASAAQQAEAARSHYRSSLKLLKARLGDEHHETLLTRMSMLQARMLDGDPSRALSELRAQLALAQRLYGASHPYVATVEHVLGNTLVGEDTQEATLHLERALRIRQRALPPEHPEVMHSFHALAVVAEQRGEIDEAWNWTEKSLELGRRIFPEDSPELTFQRLMRASLNAHRGRFEEATEEAYALIEDLEDQPRHPVFVAAHYHLAQWIDEPSAALAAARRALQLQIDVAGEKHPHTRAYALQLATLERRNGNIERAHELMREVIDGVESPPSSPVDREVLFEWVRLQFERGRGDRAMLEELRALAQTLRASGEQPELGAEIDAWRASSAVNPRSRATLEGPSAAGSTPTG